MGLEQLDAQTGHLAPEMDMTPLPPAPGPRPMPTMRQDVGSNGLVPPAIGSSLVWG